MMASVATQGGHPFPASHRRRRGSGLWRKMLFRHINTPEFHIRRPWRLGTIAVWEEHITQHRGVADFTGPRKLRRITFKGVRPAA